MQSTNFEFLLPKWPELAALGGFAESYAHGDAASALVKLRSYGEQVVEFIYAQHRFPKPYKPGGWMHLTYAAGARADIPAYVEPPPGGAEATSKKQLQREKRAVLERLAAQEAQMQKLLADLEAARMQALAAEADASQLRSAQDAALAAGRRAADALSFDEAKTRRQLIDSLLADAGWNVGAAMTSTDHVGKEVEVAHQPTASGIGYADYVLYDDDGKPLAVVEAKRTRVDPEQGRTQAKCYADGLEQAHGRRPIIFYTNGYDLWYWHDAAQETPRKLYGFPSKDTLQYRHFQVRERLPLAKVAPSPEMELRMYQTEAVRRVVEKFAEKKRKALVVQATGTGKTRIAVALCQTLIAAHWARRVLFLCDRRELRKQAHNTFKDLLPGEPRIFVTADTADDRDKRIYLATYPAMMKCFETFDVGFFDLIIADESHRSIYNRYRELFEYFDAYQVGLTATPVDHVLRDTYRIFDCEVNDPTANFSYTDAINHQPAYLVSFEVETHTTEFLREGISYAKMSREQREKLEEDEPEPAAIEYDPVQVDKRVFNKDTNRLIVRNLMERGIRDATGTQVGKSIIFARGHDHAVLLQRLFDEMYPQYGGHFCRVIDHYDPRAEDLIDDFKGVGKNPELTIAISVDMLDTGIDVPEIVNLVFARPVYSFVKFWQMIGRGTRLCDDLFGPGKDKTHFQIFDHWKNFEWFDEKYKPADPPRVKSLPQLLFESRIHLAEAALAAQNTPALTLAVDLIGKDLASLPERTIAVREKWKEVKAVSRPGVLELFDAATKAVLVQEIAPLMQWVPIAGHEEAYEFDNLVAKLQTERIKGIRQGRVRPRSPASSRVWIDGVSRPSPEPRH